LILTFVGNVAPSDEKLILTLAAAECGRGRPEASARLRGIPYSDNEAGRQCAKVMSAVRGEVP
jgi:hypothetical protein